MKLYLQITFSQENSPLGIPMALPPTPGQYPPPSPPCPWAISPSSPPPSPMGNSPLAPSPLTHGQYPLGPWDEGVCKPSCPFAAVCVVKTRHFLQRAQVPLLLGSQGSVCDRGWCVFTSLPTRLPPWGRVPPGSSSLLLLIPASPLSARPVGTGVISSLWNES